MFSKFNEEAKKALIQSKKEMSELKHSYIGTEHLLLAIIKNKNTNTSGIFLKYKIQYSNFRKKLIEVVGIGKSENDWYLYTPLLKQIIEGAIIISRDNNDNEVKLEHLILAMLEEGEGIAIRLLLEMKVDIEEVYKDFSIKKNLKKQKEKKTLLIEEYGCNMNEKSKNKELDPVIGREKEINRIIEILGRRTKNNPLLIGDAGVGKTAIVEELATRIENGNVPEKFKYKKVISISMASLIAGTKYRGEFEERINKILNEVENDYNTIIFIDEVHTLVGAGGAEGAIDASNILKPFLARGKIKVIGATTVAEYKKYIEDDRALERRFQTVLINEPIQDEVLDILKKIKPIYEDYHNVIISDDVLNTIITLSNKYIYNRKQPDKAIDVLDEVASKVSNIKTKQLLKLERLEYELKECHEEKNCQIIKRKFDNASMLKEKENEYETKINGLRKKIEISKHQRKVTPEMVAEVIKLKSNIPVYEIVSEDIKKLKNIEKALSDTVIGQNRVINEIGKSIKRIKLGYKVSNRPTSYLFAGTTGVGKTLLAKTFAKQLVGEDNLIRLDMTEYKEEHSISKIIGSPPGYVGYSEKNTILDEIKIKPNSIILLDEIDKAHPVVRSVFLQVLDEGKIKNSRGEIVRFDNTIIIMTSNISCGTTNLGFNNSINNHINSKLAEILGREFFNRIGQVLIFEQLNKKDIIKIIDRQLNKIKENFGSSKIVIDVKKKVLLKIVELSEYKEYGARKIEKVINENLYDIVIDEILKKNVNIVIETI